MSISGHIEARGLPVQTDWSPARQALTVRGVEERLLGRDGEIDLRQLAELVYMGMQASPDHRRHLARALNYTAAAAFSPRTYSEFSNPLITFSKPDWEPCALDLSVVSPVPARLIVTWSANVQFSDPGTSGQTWSTTERFQVGASIDNAVEAESIATGIPGALATSGINGWRLPACRCCVFSTLIEPEVEYVLDVEARLRPASAEAEFALSGVGLVARIEPRILTERD